MQMIKTGGGNREIFQANAVEKTKKTQGTSESKRGWTKRRKKFKNSVNGYLEVNCVGKPK